MNYECKKNKAAKNVLILTMFESITEHGRAERRRRTQSDIQFECLTFAQGKIFRQAAVSAGGKMFDCESF